MVRSIIERTRFGISRDQEVFQGRIKGSRAKFSDQKIWSPSQMEVQGTLRWLPLARVYKCITTMLTFNLHGHPDTLNETSNQLRSTYCLSPLLEDRLGHYTVESWPFTSSLRAPSIRKLRMRTPSWAKWVWHVNLLGVYRTRKFIQFPSLWSTLLACLYRNTAPSVWSSCVVRSSSMIQVSTRIL